MSPENVAGSYGEKTMRWHTEATVWAERRKLTPQHTVEVGENFADYRTEWNIRGPVHAEEGWRAEQMGGHTYNIVAIVPNPDRDYKTLVCERLNE